ncbi:hypothetical protein ACVMH6_002094 [Rhizobium leguminosarum]
MKRQLAQLCSIHLDGFCGWEAIAKLVGKLSTILDQHEIFFSATSIQQCFRKTPVPGPSSMTVPVSAEISVVMSEDNARPDGVTEATRRGAESHARKNKRASAVLLVIARWLPD